MLKFWAVSLVLAVSFIAPSLAAQEKPQPGQAPAGPVAPEDQVLKKSSAFFPDLAASRTPLTVDGKFRLFVKNSVSPGALLGAAAGAGIAQADDSPVGYGQGADGYGRRFGAALATNATSNLFGTFIISSIAHEDPRYFVHGKGAFGQRFGHAVSRVVVAPKDSGGYGFNWGGVFGPLGAETLANVYLPVHEQTGARTMERYGIHLAANAGGNILKEFWPDIFKHLGLKK